MVAVPNYTVGTTTPNGPLQGDLWYDTTNGHLNIYTGAQFVQISMPAITTTLTGSQTMVGNSSANGGCMYMPATTVTMGGTWYVPNGYVGLVFDVAHSRMCMVSSGGTTFKTVAFA